MSRTKDRLFAAIGVLGELMITAGIFLFAFVAWQVWWTDIDSNRLNNEARQELTKSWGQPKIAVKVGPEEPALNPSPPQTTSVETIPHWPFALIHVPRFADQYQARPIVHGVGTADLKRGIGHYPDTAKPGEVGNFAIAGHRTTFGKPFHEIDMLQINDPIIVQTEKDWFVYRVYESKIVTPSQVDVIAAQPGVADSKPAERYITLTACHPKLSARERYIVHGKLEHWQPKTAGTPDAMGRLRDLPNFGAAS